MTTTEIISKLKGAEIRRTVRPFDGSKPTSGKRKVKIVETHNSVGKFEVRLYLSDTDYWEFNLKEAYRLMAGNTVIYESYISKVTFQIKRP